MKVNRRQSYFGVQPRTIYAFVDVVNKLVYVGHAMRISFYYEKHRNGELRQTRRNIDTMKMIRLDFKEMSESQAKAYVSAWVYIFQDNGFKVLNDKDEYYKGLFEMYKHLYDLRKDTDILELCNSCGVQI